MWQPLSLFGSGAHFTFFTTFFHLDENYMHVVMAAIVTILLSYFSVRVHRSYQKAKNPLLPSKRLDLRNFVELVTEQLYNMFEELLGAQTKRYFPLLGAIFLYILVSNLAGLFPGFLPPTQHPSTNFAISVSIFLVYNYEGLREHGMGYLKHFLGPIALLAPMMVVLEIIQHTVRPISLSLRLLGNISGDHMVLGIFSDLVPLLIPVIFFGLGLFVAFVQAFVFTLLSTIYISMAVAHDH